MTSAVSLCWVVGSAMSMLPSEGRPRERLPQQL
jgi:hypothetical protein